MQSKQLDPNNLDADHDWEGNNAAFTCPHCGKVFIVSNMIHDGKRPCPECKKSTGYVSGGRLSKGKAKLEW